MNQCPKCGQVFGDTAIFCVACGTPLHQALKITVVETLMPIALVAGVVLYGIFFVLKIICFFQICKGKAKEPAIILSLKFLK